MNGWTSCGAFIVYRDIEKSESWAAHVKNKNTHTHKVPRFTLKHTVRIFVWICLNHIKCTSIPINRTAANKTSEFQALEKRTPTCPLCLNHASSRGYGCTFRPRCGHAHLCAHAPPPRASLSDGCVFPSRAALIRLLRYIWRVPPPLQTSIHFDATIQTPIWLLDLITRPSSVAFGCWMLLCICLRLQKTIPNSTLWIHQY